jgi:hypothetical protein
MMPILISSALAAPAKHAEATVAISSFFIFFSPIGTNLFGRNPMQAKRKREGLTNAVRTGIFFFSMAFDLVGRRLIF